MYKNLIQDYEQETGSPFTDSLTGLFNHGLFQLTLERELARSSRQGEPFSLALVDIDSFARYNEKYGHATADRMLKKVAELAAGSLREADLASRFAGDVFALLLIGTDTQLSKTVGERVRQTVEKHFSGKLTVSIGIASYPQDGKTRRELIKSATKALQQAKINGKNRVDCFVHEENDVEHDTPRVLIVDDDARNVKLLEAMLYEQDVEIAKAYNGFDALDLVEKNDIDLILLDVMMPGIDGFEVCRRLKTTTDTRLIPVILITALENTEAKVKGIEAGADDFITKPPNREELLARTRSLINMHMLNQSLTSIENVLFSLASAVEAKDSYTEGHTKRVANLAVSLGRKLNLKGKDIEALKFGGILHDVGKIGVPGEILNKPGPLDPEEWEIMMNHTDLGYKICLPLKNILGTALDVIRHHHEKLSGTGYPDKLKGEDISMPARAMAVVDIYDALITERPYRKALSTSEALDILEKEAREKKLDGQVVDALIELVRREEMEEKTDIEISNIDKNGQSTILVIEDNELNMKLVRSLLKFENYIVLEAINAEQGIELARNHIPDLILMDIQLPGMDGLSATRRIKEDNSLKKIPVVALTSYAMQGDEEKALDAGCSGYISKPIDTKIFVSIIEGHLN